MYKFTTKFLSFQILTALIQQMKDLPYQSLCNKSTSYIFVTNHIYLDEVCYEEHIPEVNKSMNTSFKMLIFKNITDHKYVSVHDKEQLAN